MTINKCDQTLSKPTDIANSFNNFFLDDIENNIKIDMKLDNYKLDNMTTQSMFMQPVQINDIVSAIRSLKNTSTVGYDGMSTKVIKFVNELIAPILAHIINLGIVDGVFPEDLKSCY